MNRFKFIILIIFLIICVTFSIISIITTLNNEKFTKNNSIYFMIINMSKNKDRWDIINKSFKDLKAKYNLDYTRIEGVDGRNMDNDNSIYDILKPREDLISRTFICKENKNRWTYDGSIKNSFPGLHLDGHHGTKGLTMSNLKCFKHIKDEQLDFKWYCIIEDDSIFNDEIYRKILHIIHNNKDIDVILLDDRGRGGTSCLLYKNTIIDKLYKDLHPISDFSIENSEGKYGGSSINLWDWKLWVYFDNKDINNKTIKLVKSGEQGSTIN